MPDLPTCPTCGTHEFRRIAWGSYSERQYFDASNLEWDFKNIAEELEGSDDWTCINDHTFDVDTLDDITNFIANA